MRNLRIIITVVIISVIAILMGSAIRSYYLFLKEPVLPVINALPGNTAIFISTKSAFKLFESVNNSALIDIIGSASGTYNQLNSYLDSIKLKSSKLRKLLETSEVLISIYPEQNYSDLLLVCSVGKISNRSIITEFEKILANDSCLFLKSNREIVKVTSIKGDVWFYLFKGVLAISNDSTLINRSLESINSDISLASDKSVVKLIAARGKRVDANLIINTKILTETIWPDHSGLLIRNTPFDEWISFDLNIKKNAVLLGGFTTTQCNHLFRGQEPIENYSYNYYPRNTSLAITLSLSDPSLYISNFIKTDTIHVKGYDPFLRQQTEEIFKPSDHIRSWIGDHINLIFTIDYFRGHTTGQIVMIECRDKDSASLFLRPFVDPINDSVGYLHYQSFAEDLFGNAFEMKGPLFCLITDRFVNISPDRNLLFTGTKSNTRHIRDFDNIIENTSNNSTISVLIRPEIVARWIKNKSLNKPLLSFLSRQSSIGLQYSAGGDLEYTHAWLCPNIKSKPLFAENEYKRSEEKKKPTAKDVHDTTSVINENSTETEDNSTTQQQLSFESKEINIKSSVKACFVVNGPQTKQKCIAIITEKGELLLVNSDGRKLWRYRGTEALLPSVCEIDQNKDGKPEYLLSSRSFLYHIDTKGNLIEKNPVKLPRQAKGNISVFDYDAKKEYRILYVASDNKIYNVTTKGIELPDWQKPSVDGNGTITFSRTNGRDYIIYHNEKQIKIFDRRGKERIKVAKGINFSKNSSISENKTNSKGIFISSSNKGELIYINQSGTHSKTSFGFFSNDPWFKYYDFDSDGSMDYIFVDKNKITVFNRMKEVITEKKGWFGNPYIYASSSIDNWLFARDNNTNEVIALHNKGKKLDMNSLHSDTDPFVFNPGGSNKELLVTTKKEKLILTSLDRL
ncbi:MAG TPA: hypothetical protein VK212_10435 [Lentimicrobium sp.]|nr:hypothetical protein [Lentimicrobium sp.]